MAIDPQAKAVLDIMTAGLSLDQRGVEGAREWARSLAPAPDPPDPRLETEDRTLGGVGVRIYRPPTRGSSPVIVFIHGGGWVLGGLDSVEFACRELALASGVAVVSVDYRLSPEAQFPAALQDCLAVLGGVVNQAAALGLDRGAICVAGESSGGQLAAATCLSARDQELPVAAQLLVCPVIDPGMDTPSWREFGDEYLPVARQMSWMWDLYAPTSMKRSADPLVNLAIDRDFSGLPQTIILTSEFDPLRDEAEEYGRRLARDGVVTEVRRLDGQIHAIFGAARAVDACAAELRRVGQDIGRKLQHQPIGGRTS